MTYVKEATTTRYCPTCKTETEHYKAVDLCIECFRTNPGVSQGKKKAGKQGELF